MHPIASPDLYGALAIGETRDWSGQAIVTVHSSGHCLTQHTAWPLATVMHPLTITARAVSPRSWKHAGETKTRLTALEGNSDE